MTIAVVAEKPAVARDIAKVLGAVKRGDGYLHGGGYVITWAIGHLVALAEPAEINTAWKYWNREQLPMLPKQWSLKVISRTVKQFEVVQKILTSAKIEEVVCATDAGREGELIFRYIYEHAGCKAPISRLWISSLTSEAIRQGFDSLKDGADYEALSDAAKGRSRADWLVGMNLSRAYCLAHGKGLSVGRVQTPTLAMIVEREIAIREFNSDKYIEIQATFSPDKDVEQAKQREAPSAYQGTWFEASDSPGPKTVLNNSKVLSNAKRLPADGKQVPSIIKRVKSGRGEIESVKAKPKKMAPPLLYDLTELQRHANRLYGFSAKKTLQLAQQLYEEKKLISYPRTDSRYLTKDVAGTLERVVKAVAGPDLELLPENIGKINLGKRYINDAKVSDHHAIIPTPVNPTGKHLSADQEKLYDLVRRRLLMAWLKDHLTRVTTVITTVASGANGDTVTDRFHSIGTSIEQMGWKVLDIKTKKKRQKNKKDMDANDQKLPPGLEMGQSQKVLEVEGLEKQTKPPKRFTDASLLTAMETAGKMLDDKELSDAMKERGLGTPATRAAIIETLISREFVKRTGKTFEATPKGERLIDVVHPQVKSPQMTGDWEMKLKKIEHGEGDFDNFMSEIESYVSEVVGSVFNKKNSSGRTHQNQSGSGGAAASFNKRSSSPGADDEPPPPAEEPPWLVEQTPPLISPATAGKRAQTKKTNPRAVKSTPAQENPIPESTSKPVETIQGVSAAAIKMQAIDPSMPDRVLKEFFGHTAFRPYQEDVCRKVVDGSDVLLVMPTGAGKSLCYQLPGVARKGTTLVVSPLIALMEDQVTKLQEQNFHAERIHSGRSRLESRQVCKDYLAGNLDFLFIAPERLRVPGFPEMLAKRKPVLIAIDEAHCISHWGHDFRPDYRMLGERLPILRPAPVIAMTATATKLVQDDISRLLELKKPTLAIHGFRRTNIAIEVVEMPPADRREAALVLLSKEDRRPAIIYAPTRKKTEELADFLSNHYPSAAYHAGLPAKVRDKVQTAFLSGELEIIVATIAFGMGIDKANIRTVVHTALPATTEGYYQEIGRAGRDGEMSRAILYYSYADLRIHQFLHDKSYPHSGQLHRLYSSLSDNQRISKEELNENLGMDEDLFNTALEKLWIHGGAIVDPEENITKGRGSWALTYEEQSEHKMKQLEMMAEYAQHPDCRMLKLVKHFGDRADDGSPCGICDFCAPDKSIAEFSRPPDSREVMVIGKVIEILRETDSLSTGRLHGQACNGSSLERRDFERLLMGMARAGLVDISEHNFSKDGKEIRYQRAELTPEGYGFNISNSGKISIAGVPESSLKKRKKRKRKKTATSRTARILSDASNPPDPQLEKQLRAWRLVQARKRGIPAFRILGDKTLRTIAAFKPQYEDDLLAIKGIGQTILDKYGSEILKIISQYR